MPERDSDNSLQDWPFQDWFASSQDFLGTHQLPPALAEKCVTLFEAWQRFAGVMAKATGGAPVSGGPFDPAGWVDLAGGGGLGDLWDWFGGGQSSGAHGRRKALEETQEWIAYGAALNRYRAVLGAAWLSAFTRFAEEMTANGAVGAKDFPAMQACWQRAADEELAAAQRSQAYLGAQRDLIRARLDCASALRAQADDLARLLGLPTRAEVNALHSTVNELRQELRRHGEK